MADQQLDVFDSDDEEERLFQALSAFKTMVRNLVERTGLSTNEFERMHNFGDGKVSTWATAKRTGPNIPPLRFVEDLAIEAQERGGLQDEAAVLFQQQYGELLKMYCARKVPHNTHRQMLAEYQDTMLIRELNTAMNAAHNTMVRIAAELETLREDRDGERQRRLALQQQLAALRAENDRWAADKHAALVRRDRVRAELAGYERGQQPDVRHEPAVDLGGSHAHHLQTAPALAPGTLKRFPASIKVAGATAAAVVLVFAGIGMGQVFGKNTPSGTSEGKGTTTTSPPQTPSPEPSTQQPADEATPTRTQAAPKPLAVGDLNFTGANWVQGTWTLNGRKYGKSLAWVQPCAGSENVVIRLPRASQHFTAEVGFAEGEGGEHKYTAQFDVWADRDGDGHGGSDELVSSRGVTFDKPATLAIDDLRGASQIILSIHTSDCIAAPLVWGSPQVS
ncbi:hypothetical protein ACFY2M_42955 [Streptomyces sp. NPDC001276]|uniref:hypothetical protein n=1 Tax=Streptomyces sp. NPDC001276 TaxID=3364555 RepID=UPI003676B2D7